MHRLIPYQRFPRHVKRPQTHARVYSPFDEAMVLLSEVIQVLDGSQLAALNHDFFKISVAQRVS